MSNNAFLGNAPEPLSLFGLDAARSEPRNSNQKKKARRAKKKKKKGLTEDEKRELVRDVCLGNKVGIAPTKIQGERRDAEVMAAVCAGVYAKYHKSRVHDWQRSIRENKGVLGCYSRAAVQANMLNASYLDYVRAQFFWINDYFSRAPRYAEIASPGAIARYQKWKILQEEGQVPPHVVHPACVGLNMTEEIMSSESMIAYEEKVLARMVISWGSEKTVWEMFGLPGDQEVFTDVFKMTRPIWKEMYTS